MKNLFCFLVLSTGFASMAHANCELGNFSEEVRDQIVQMVKVLAPKNIQIERCSRIANKPDIAMVKTSPNNACYIVTSTSVRGVECSQ